MTIPFMMSNYGTTDIVERLMFKCGVRADDIHRVAGLTIWEVLRDDHNDSTRMVIAAAMFMSPCGSAWPWEVALACMTYVTCETRAFDVHMLQSTDFVDGNHQHVRRFLLDSDRSEWIPENVSQLARDYREWAVANDEWDCWGTDAPIEELCEAN